MKGAQPPKSSRERQATISAVCGGRKYIRGKSFGGDMNSKTAGGDETHRKLKASPPTKSLLATTLPSETPETASQPSEQRNWLQEKEIAPRTEAYST
jgi:hypothetical protein